MGGFPKTSPAVLSLFSEASAGLVGEARLMFGCPCLFVGGNMAAGTFGDHVFFRVPREGQAALISADPRLRPFEPVAGRPLRDYLEGEATALGAAELRRHLEAAFARAAALPPKEKKARRGG